MAKMKNILPIFAVFLVLYDKSVSASSNRAFDFDLYDDVLDPVECERQLRFIRNNETTLRMQFIDASWRIPKSILKGNTLDLGNYFQCLDISSNFESQNMHIGGKYCTIDLPLQQDNFELPPFPPINPNITWPNITWPDLPGTEIEPELPLKLFNPETTFFTEEIRAKLRAFERQKNFLGRLLGDNPTPSRNEEEGNGQSMTLELAVCIPKVCTPREALNSFTNDLASTLTYEENFCRLNDDKSWAGADTVAVIILSIIGLITILSTAYDIRHTLLLEQDPKKANKVYQSFSLYTNTKNFFVFPSGPSVVTCLDGIRSFAMIWVIVGHTFVTQLTYIPENPLDIINFIMQFSSLWITSATITVDTFFMISGLLVVYTSAAKMSRNALVKNIHLFYINRLLRMFPVLAFGVLMVSSFWHRTADGPYFYRIENWVNNCRSHWWSTLLYVQNFVNPSGMCLPHSWYLAIDMQLHILAPVVLFFILGQRRLSSWLALSIALIAFIVASTIYNFMHDFTSAVVSLARPEDGDDYLRYYYVHTLPRAAPFFVGMIFGYLLHLYREKKPRMPKLLVLCCWVLAIAGTTGVCLITYWNIQPDWDNQTMDNVFNSFKRPIWAASVGWIVFACHNGLGGPVNWLLSLTVFKILGRLSYAMYILHYPLIYLLNATTLAPIYFSIHFSMYRFFTDFSLAIIAAFLVTIIIDFPFANLIKMGMDIAAPKRRPRPKETPSITKEDPEITFNKEEPQINYESIGFDDEKKTKL